MSSYNFEIECPFCHSENVQLDYAYLEKLIYICSDCGEVGNLDDFLFIFRKNHENN